MSNELEHFEQNMLDGDSIDDCGGAMISAKACFDYSQAAREDELGRIKKKLRKLAMCNICGGAEIVNKILKEKTNEN